MDSFFEQPRTTPRPTPVSQDFKTPVVPDASLIFQNPPKNVRITPKMSKTMQHQSYNAWKLRNSPQLNAQYDSFLLDPKSVGEKENNKICQNFANYQYLYNTNKVLGEKTANPNGSLMFKKQVRFESPTYVQPAPSNLPLIIQKSPNFSALLRKADDKVLPEKNRGKKPSEVPKQKTELTKTPVSAASPIVQGCNVARLPAPLEKFYLENAPNTKLDLSIFEHNKYEPNLNHTNLYQQSNKPPKSISEERFEKSTLNSVGVQNLTLQYQVSSTNQPIFSKTTLPYPTLSTTFKNFHPSNIVKNTAPLQNDYHTSDVIVINDEEIKKPEKKTCSCDCSKNTTNQEKDNVEPNDDLNNTSSEKTENIKDPTVTELLGIVKMQNEQLQLLQSQVQKLIKMNEINNIKITESVVTKQVEKLMNLKEKKRILNTERGPKHMAICKKKETEINCDNRKEARRERKPKNNVVIYKDEQVGTSFEEGIRKRITKENIVTKDTRNEKISVGIMTSFEVSYKSPTDNRKPARRKRESENSSVISEEEYPANTRLFSQTWDSKKNETEYSLALDEPLDIQEAPISPNNTVHINMQDYDSDSDDESSSVNPSWTFYDNILGKVNNLLENSPSPGRNRENQRSNRGGQTKRPTDCTLNVIKEATLQNLQREGFGQGAKDYTNMKPNEISFAVKQLLMKYMPDEGLANIATKQMEGRRVDSGDSADMSIATVRYLQEYNISNVPKGHPRMANNQGKQIRSSLKRTSGQTSDGAKILDITTLKQQPKLL